MASRGRPFQGQTISLGDSKGEIQLTDRQLQLLEARKVAKQQAAAMQTSQLSGSQHHGAKGRDPTPRMSTKWNDDQTMPSTWSESSSNASSSVSMARSRAASSVVSAAMSRAASSTSSAFSHSSNAPKSFYGQGLVGQSKKLYDDSGASYIGSKSEASTMMKNNQQQQHAPVVMPRRVDRVPKRTVPVQGPPPPPPPPRQHQAAPQSTLGDDHQQKAFLRKMMQSYTTKPRKDKTDETVSEASSANESKRKSWVGRKSNAPSSSSGSSSASHDRAIMRKVLERARNKKISLANPRKQGLMKSSSSKMKKLLSPKKDSSGSSPKSDASSDAGSNSSSRSFGFGKFGSKKKAGRSPRFSSRKAKTRMYDKSEALFPAKVQEHETVSIDLDKITSTDSTASETQPSTNASAGASKSASISTKATSKSKKLYDDSGASVIMSDGASETSGVVKRQATDISVKSIKPNAIEIQRQATDVSALTRKQSHETTESGTLSRKLSEYNAEIEHVAATRTIEAIPQVTNEDEIEIKLSVSSMSQKYEDGENKYSIPYSETAKSAVFPSKHGETVYDDTEFDAYDEPEMFNPEPEGYRDFLQTLKAEVSGTHSQLWESFHSLFRGPQSFTRPLDYGTVSGKFDDKTKAAVAKMSTHLKTEYGAQSEAGTQLANDKAVKAARGSFGKINLKRTNQHPPRPMPKSRHSYAGFCNNPSFDSLDEPPIMSKFDDFLSKNVRRTLGEKAAQALIVGDETESDVSSYAASSYIESTYLSEAGSLSASEASSRGGPTPKSTAKEVVEPESTKSLTSTSSSKRNFKVSKNKIPSVEPPKSETSAPSFTGVKLRSVTPSTDAPGGKPSTVLRSIDETPKSESSSSASSIPSSWAKVKLRKVEKKEEKTERKSIESGIKPTDKNESDSIHHFVVRKPLAAKPKSPTAYKPGPNVEPDKAMALKVGNEPVVSEKKESFIEESTSEDWDLQAITSSISTDSSTDGTTVVALAPGPESKTFFGLKVVVGKRGIMKIDFPPNLSQAKVIWRLELDELKSAMLDMSAYKVKLLQANGEHKDLVFESSENCMKFANAFHEVANGGEDDLDDETEYEDSDGSVFVEQLSEEEQRVLKEFRKKKRLSKDPSEEKNANPQVEPDGITLHEHIKSKAQQPPSILNGKPTTPTSEASTTDPSLTSEEQKIVDSYKKMLKLKIPADAVRHKMEKENVDIKLMEIVLGGGESSSPTPVPAQAASSLSVPEQAVAATYQRMLKMSVPPEGVRHRMEKDGVDVKIILAVFGGDAGDAVPTPALSTASNISVDEEKIAASYKKMLKLMMPKEAVEHKMRKDGIAPNIMAYVLGVDPVSFGGGGASAKSKITLTDEEESIASSFRKMLSLKISKESVRKKMQTDGISEKIMVSVLGEAFMKGSNRNSKHTPPRRHKGGFHWSPLTSEENLRRSVWNKSSMSEYAESDVASDISKHLELFQKKEDGNDASKTVIKKADGTETKVMAKLIDLNRANNVAITLKAFNEVSLKELAQIIEFVDPHGKIKGDRALFMRDLLPAPAEVKVIEKYAGSDACLVPAEIWFKKIVHIKRIEEKIKVMRTMETFKLEVLALAESFQMLIKVCNQVVKSEKLPDLLEMVRQIGNRMNEGRGEEAAGFKLDFLSRLSQTKGSDKKTTALDLVVMIFLTRNQRAALRLSADFPECHEASKLQIKDLNADVKRLGDSLQLCKKEMELLRKDGNIPKWGKLPEDSKEEIGPTNSAWFASRSNFLSSVVGGANAEAPKPEVKAAPTSKPPGSSDSSKASSDDSADGYSLRNSVEKIEKFLKEANEGYEQLKAVNEEAIKTCKELSDFFCEKGGERATSKLIGILAEFASNLDCTVKKQDEQEKRREARQKSANLRKSQTILPSSIPRSPSRTSSKSPTNSNVSNASDDSIGGKSLVFMVNQMLKMGGDKMKEDFAKGLTYDETRDKNLKQIYEVEKSRETAKSIVGKIASRRETSERVTETGLSDLVKRIEHRSKNKPKQNNLVGKPPMSAKRIEETDSKSSTIERVPSQESRNDNASDRRRRSSVADRWTRKMDDDQVSDSGNSATLSSFSSFSEDGRIQERRRNKVINRWQSNQDIVEVASKDFEEGSDVGFSNDVVNKTRERYLSRWATRPKDEEEVSDL